MGSTSRLATGALALALLGLAPARSAAQEAAWPPSPEVRARMAALQAVLISRDSDAAARQAAREELIRLLRSPAAPEPDVKAGPSVPRAAIDPLPSLAFPAASANPPALPRIAPALVTLPPRPNPVVDPANGRVLTPAGRAVVDPLTGRVLQETPGAFIDPLTGRVVPR
jgi:hypothetical protein